MIEIVKYDESVEDILVSLLKQERDWDFFTNQNSLGSFKKVLLESTTLVCYLDGELCGYLRAIDDPFGIYVSELYVIPKSRSKGCGRELLYRLKSLSPGRDIYVLSDEDKYYEKLSLSKVGSVFKA